MIPETLMYAYFFLGGALLMLVLLGLLVSASMPGMEKWSRRFFVASFSILMLSIAAYLMDLLIFSDPNLAWAERIIASVETFVPSVLMPLLAAYILRCCRENRRSALLYTELAFLSALFILLCVTHFTQAIYYFTPDNQFVRGPLYPILIVPMIAMVVVDLVGVIRRRHKLTKKHYIAFLVYLLPPLIAMTVQAFTTAFLLIVAAVSVSALSMLGIVLADQVEQHMRQQREIANQRASIAVLQMRPHFIYNTMMSIYYLCEQNSKKAQQVILDFTTYLRKNFNAIASDDTIPFSEELKHTCAYLAVEQGQYEDNLFVEYDTPHTLFRVPPLTLQPIVENAVKHGMDPDAAEPLRISIKTKQAGSGYEIVVEDNGPGFQPTDDKEPHIALKSIRERLSMMCGGTLEIAEREAGGTRVTIRIPMKKPEERAAPSQQSRRMR